MRYACNTHIALGAKVTRVGYRHIADEVEARIRAGELAPGDQLPTQRAFAKREGIAASTAARVYRELTRRGLISGEVGRGSFVRATSAPTSLALTEPTDTTIDLSFNFPVPDVQVRLGSEVIAGMAAGANLAASMTGVGPTGTPQAREAVATLTYGGWSPAPDDLVFAGSGRQAIAAAIATLVPTGGSLGVEELTYPVVKGIAERLGVDLVPLHVDEHGVTAEAIRSRHAAARLDAVYLQPTLHNPLGVTMPAERREQVAEVLVDLDLVAIEDAVYSFLARDVPPPLAASVPERVVLVDSFSKRFAPGLTVGTLVCPPALRPELSRAIRTGGWSTSRFALNFVTELVASGALTTIEDAKRRDAAERQRLVAQLLPSRGVRTDDRAYHCWWRLPGAWRADLFIAVAAREGIAVTPGSAFAVAPGAAADCVRLALATPSLDVLADGLERLHAISRGEPASVSIE